MLTKSELFKVLKFLRLCSILGPLPIQVNVRTWNLKAPSTIKKCVCAVSYGLVVLHILYKNGSLAYAYLFLPHVQLHQFIIHATVAMGTAMCGFWYYMVYIKDPGLFVVCAKTTMTGQIGGSRILSQLRCTIRA